jgi:hypothetical protein
VNDEVVTGAAQGRHGGEKSQQDCERDDQPCATPASGVTTAIHTRGQTACLVMRRAGRAGQGRAFPGELKLFDQAGKERRGKLGPRLHRAVEPAENPDDRVD